MFGLNKVIKLNWCKSNQLNEVCNSSSWSDFAFFEGFFLRLVSSPRLCVMFFVFFSFYFLLYFKDLFDGERERGKIHSKGTWAQTSNWRSSCFILKGISSLGFHKFNSLLVYLSLSAVFTLLVFVKLSPCLPSRPVSLFFFHFLLRIFSEWSSLFCVSCLHRVARCYLSGVFKVPFPSSLQRH